MFSCKFSNLLLLLLAVSVRGQEEPTQAPTTLAPTMEPWGGCTVGDQFVTIGEKTSVCLILANNLNWNSTVSYMRLFFQPEADQYSRILVQQSYKEISARSVGAFTGDVAVHVASQTALSFQKLYYNSAENKVYSTLTAIIDVEDGVVKGISWDDGCIFCKSSECDENTYFFNGTVANPVDDAGSCGNTVDECSVAAADADSEIDCDLFLYVVWTGTDSNGRAFKSAAYRFSAFPTQELGDNFDISIPTFKEINPFDDEA